MPHFPTHLHRPQSHRWRALRSITTVFAVVVATAIVFAGPGSSHTADAVDAADAACTITGPEIYGSESASNPTGRLTGHEMGTPIYTLRDGDVWCVGSDYGWENGNNGVFTGAITISAGAIMRVRGLFQMRTTATIPVADRDPVSGDSVGAGGTISVMGLLDFDYTRPAGPDDGTRTSRVDLFGTISCQGQADNGAVRIISELAGGTATVALPTETTPVARWTDSQSNTRDIVRSSTAANGCGFRLVEAGEATVTIEKTVINDDGGTAVVDDFNIATDAGPINFGSPATSSSAAIYIADPITINMLDGNTITLTESDLARYAEGTWNCTAGVLNDNSFDNGSLTLTSGDNAVCSITNDDLPLPELTIEKQVDNQYGGNATINDFGITTSAGSLSFDAGSTSGTVTTYTSDSLSPVAGTYTLSELDLDGYTEGTWSCNGASNGAFDNGSITLGDGDEVTCTITNAQDADPGIDLVKTVAVGAGQACPGVSADSVTLSDPGVVTYCYLVTNTGNVPLTDVTVTDDNATPANTADDFTVDLGSAPVTLQPGESIVGSADVTITDTQFGADVDIVNVATATGTPPAGDPPTDDDTATVDPEPTPDIAVVKNVAVGAGQPCPGVSADSVTLSDPGVVTYCYLVTNTGNVALTDVTVTDDNATPANTADDFTVDLGATPVTLQPGESITGSADVTITDTQFGSNVDIVNVATASGTPPAGDPPTDDDTATVDPDPNLGIDLVKTVAVGAGQSCPGVSSDQVTLTDSGVVTYCYLVTNTGNVPLTDVTVTDDNATPANTADDFTVDLGATPVTLQPGESITGSADVTITDTQFGADIDIVNVATATGTPPSGDPPTDDDTATVDPEPTPDIAVVKTVAVGAGQPCPGVSADSVTLTDPGDVTYCYLVTNTGNVPLTDVTVTDDNATPANTADDFTVDLGATPVTLQPGESITGSADVTITDTQFGADINIVNIATATGTPPSGDPPTDDDTATVDPEPTPNIDVVKTVAVGAGQSCPGVSSDQVTLSSPGTVTYCYLVTNTGNVALTDVTVTDDNATPANTADDFTVDLGATPVTLQPGESITGSADVTITDTQFNADIDIVNVATATGTPPSGDPPTDDDTGTVDPQPIDLELVKTVSEANPFVGETVTFSIALANQGTGDATGVEVTDVLPAGLTSPNAISNGATVGVDANGNTTITWSNVDVASQETVVFTYDVIVGSTGPWDNVAYVTAHNETDIDSVPTDGPDPDDDGLIGTIDSNPNDGSVDPDDPAGDDSDNEPVNPVNLSVAKSVSAPVPVAGADNTYDLTYTVEVTNNGPGTNTYDVTDELSLATGVTVLSVSPVQLSDDDQAAADPGPTAGFTGSAPDTELVADETITANGTDVFTYTVRIVADPASYDTTGNACSATGAEATAVNTATLSTGAQAQACTDVPMLTIEKIFGAASDPDGDGEFAVTYTVNVTNNGDVDTEYTLVDTPGFDDDLTIATPDPVAAATPGSPAPDSNTWDGTSLTIQGSDTAIAVGQTHTYTVTINVDAATVVPDPTLYSSCDASQPVAGQGLFNTAMATFAGGDIAGDDCGDLPLANVELTKTVTNITALDNDARFAVTYDVVVTSTGASPAAYDLTDTPAFDDDLTIVSATATATTGALIADFDPASTIPWELASDAVIGASPATHTYTLTFIVDATDLMVAGGIDALTSCAVGAGAGSGLFNQAGLEFVGGIRGADACTDPIVPDISLIKSVVSVNDVTDAAGSGSPDGLIGVGDTITYSFTVTNTGNTHLLLADTLVDETLASANPAVTVNCPGPITLAPGESTTACVADNDYTLTEVDFARSGVENTATVIGTPVDPSGTVIPSDPSSPNSPRIPDVSDVSDTGTPTTTDGDPITPIEDPESEETPNPLEQNPNDPDDPTEDPTTVLLTPIADLSIVKTASTGTLLVGGEVTWTLVIENHGPNVARDVVVTDQVPSEVQISSVVSLKLFCTTSGNSVSCNVDSLVPGETAVVAINAKLLRAPQGGILLNSTEVTSSTPDPVPPNNEDTVETPVPSTESAVVPPGLPAPKPPAPKPQPLPTTGADGLGLQLSTALGLFMLGALMAAGSRRRRKLVV